MRVPTALVILLVGAIVPRVGHAEPQAVAASDTPVRIITFNHNGRNTTGYALYATPDGGSEQRIDIGYARPDRTGTVHIPLPALPPGTYQFAIAAYNAAGESSKISATPARIVLADRTTPSNDAKPDPAPKGMPPSRPVSAGPPRRGLLGRLWQIVAGSDDH